MKYKWVLEWLLITLFFTAIVGCRSIMKEEIDTARKNREVAVIKAAKDYFIESGGYLPQYPALFDSRANIGDRIDQARLVLYHLGKDETVPSSLVNRMSMYLTLMLSEADYGNQKYH